MSEYDEPQTFAQAPAEEADQDVTPATDGHDDPDEPGDDRENAGTDGGNITEL